MKINTSSNLHFTSSILNKNPSVISYTISPEMQRMANYIGSPNAKITVSTYVERNLKFSSEVYDKFIHFEYWPLHSVSPSVQVTSKPGIVFKKEQQISPKLVMESLKSLGRIVNKELKLKK